MRQVGFLGRAALIFGCLLATSQAAPAGRSSPLVDGNQAAYWPRLQKPADPAGVGEVLDRIGFNVPALRTLDDQAATRALALFVGKIEAGDEAVVCFSARGVAINGRTYRLPLDFDEPEYRSNLPIPGAAPDADDFRQKRARPHSLAVPCRDKPLEGIRPSSRQDGPCNDQDLDPDRNRNTNVARMRPSGSENRSK